MQPALQACDVAVGTHLDQKPSICQRFIYEQTILKNVPISNLFRRESVGCPSIEPDAGIKDTQHQGWMSGDIFDSFWNVEASAIKPWR